MGVVYCTTMATLYIVSTPIGNLEDISIRAIRTLFTVDIIACEDTRRTGVLLSEIKKRYTGLLPAGSENIHPNYIRFDDRTEQSGTPELIDLLKTGKSVALVSDAGTPLINDPGYFLVREAGKRDIPVISIPGPSALMSALTISGLPADKFMFLGFPPEKQSHRKKLFTDLPKGMTLIFYSAPHKLRSTLEDLKDTLGDCDITICRELTKIHEEIWQGSITSSIEHFNNVKGELVICFRL